MSFSTPNTAFRGAVARAIAQAYERRQAGKDVSGSFPCPRCGSPVKFTTLMTGLSYGRCASAGCVRWVQ